MHHIIGDAPGMIFGPTGSGKSMLVRSVIQSAIKHGVKAAVCDTEANYMQEDTEWLQANTKYKHVDSLQGILDWLRSLTGFKLIVVKLIGNEQAILLRR
jgi:sigma54-dependent transcription regulator